MNSARIASLIENAPDIDNPLVAQLRREDPSLTNTKMLECQVVLRSGYQMAGVLMTSEGAAQNLRLSALAQTPDKRVMVADHHFAPDDVETIVIGRPFEQRVVGSDRPSIILGH